jgi:hypothetical protein
MCVLCSACGSGTHDDMAMCTETMSVFIFSYVYLCLCVCM